MNRREFMKSGAAAMAGASASAAAVEAAAQQPCPGKAPADQNRPTGVDFDFTGLFTFKLQQNKEMQVLLLDAKKAKLKDAHAAFLMMPFSAYHAPKTPKEAGEAFKPPNIVRLGKEAMAVWSLVDHNIWVADAHELFDGNACVNDLHFIDTEIGCDPDPIDKDEGWASLKWFAMLPDLLKTKDGEEIARRSGFPKCEDKMVTSYVRLTTGTAGGRAPATKCERERKYTLDKIAATARTYATQMHVVYTANAGILKLGIARKAVSSLPGVPKVIHVNVKQNELTPLTIVNTPLTHEDSHHYRAFYELVDKDGRELNHNVCALSGSAPDHQHALASGPRGIGGSLPSAPDPDCIPPGMTG
jgi:hypothetical protein